MLKSNLISKTILLYSGNKTDVASFALKLTSFITIAGLLLTAPASSSAQDTGVTDSELPLCEDIGLDPRQGYPYVHSGLCIEEPLPYRISFNGTQCKVFSQSSCLTGDLQVRCVRSIDCGGDSGFGAPSCEVTRDSFS